MSQLKMTKISADIPPNQFNCGNSSINTLISESYWPTILQHAYAYEVSSNDIVLGYFMLIFMGIELEHCPGEISNYYSSMCNYCFSLHIKYIAIDLKYQSQGIGYSTLKYIIKATFTLAELWPIRLITIDALKERYDWYKNIGFLPLNEDEMKNNEPTLRMYMDCIRNQDLVNNYIENNC